MNSSFKYVYILIAVLCIGRSEATPAKWSVKGLNAYRDGDRPLALTYFNKALESAMSTGTIEDIVRTRLNLVDMHLEAEDAVLMASQLNAMPSEIPASLRWQVDWKKAQFYIVALKIDSAKIFFEKAIAECGKEKECSWIRTDDLRAQVFHLPTEQLSALSQNISQLTDGPGKWGIQALYQMRLGNYTEANVWWERAAEGYRKNGQTAHFAKTLFHEAVCHLKLQKIDKARELQERALFVARKLEIPLPALRMNLLSAWLNTDTLVVSELKQICILYLQENPGISAHALFYETTQMGLELPPSWVSMGAK